MKKILVIFVIVLFHSQVGWTQIEQQIIGNWEVASYDLSEENVGEQQKSTEILWTFKNNNICEERSAANNLTIYEYKISRANCENGITSAQWYYINLINKTVPGDNYCFEISFYKNTKSKREILRLYSAGAMQPNVLVSK